MKICGIYKITSPTNKIYIGQSINIIKRWQKYYNLNCKQQPKIYASLVKYGANKHKFEIICQCDKLELNNLEKYYIDLYKSFNSKHGLNLLDGGNSVKMSDETRHKMSLAKIGKKRNVTDKHRENLSKSRLGKKLSESHINSLKLSSINKNAKPIYQYDMNDNLICEWVSSVVASKELNICSSHISKCCRNIKGFKSAGNFKWKYK
jgi:group I intron endonuclease